MSLLLNEMVCSQEIDELYLVDQTFNSAATATAAVSNLVKAGDLIIVYCSAGRGFVASTNNAVPAGYTTIAANVNFTTGGVVYSAKTYGKIATAADAATTHTPYGGAASSSVRIMIFRRRTGIINTVTYVDFNQYLAAAVPAGLTTVNSVIRTRPCAYFINMILQNNITQNIQYTITNPVDYLFTYVVTTFVNHLVAVKSFPVGTNLVNNTYKANTTTGASFYLTQHFFVEYT